MPSTLPARNSRNGSAKPASSVPRSSTSTAHVARRSRTSDLARDPGVFARLLESGTGIPRPCAALASRSITSLQVDPCQGKRPCGLALRALASPGAPFRKRLLQPANSACWTIPIVVRSLVLSDPRSAQSLPLRGTNLKEGQPAVTMNQTRAGAWCCACSAGTLPFSRRLLASALATLAYGSVGGLHAALALPVTANRPNIVRLPRAEQPLPTHLRPIVEEQPVRRNRFSKPPDSMPAAFIPPMAAVGLPGADVSVALPLPAANLAAAVLDIAYDNA